MANSKGRAPSPVRAGFFHGFLSLVVFGGVSGLAGVGIQLMGDPAEAGPVEIVALFERDPTAARSVRDKLVTEPQLAPAIELAQSGGPAQAPAQTVPNLGVSDPGSPAPAPTGRVQTVAAAAPETARPEGLTINGVFVPIGKSYRQIEEGSGPSPVTQVSAPATGSTSASAAPASPDAPVVSSVSVSSPAERNSRPFDNPEGKPVVALIIGGLGTSTKQSIAAIDDLPPEVTLSFIADASSRLIRRAREKGHEVLLEVPMEPYERGRAIPHSQTLLAAGSAEDNKSRLDALLRGGSEFYGVINHHGEKFADADGALPPIFERLHQRGLAFFRHGATPSKSFDAAAAEEEVVYAAASENIDTQVSAEAIERRLQALESTALTEGAALGTGFAYPLTMDIIIAWTRRLEAKGILLAPASAVPPVTSQPAFQTSQLERTATSDVAR